MRGIISGFGLAVLLGAATAGVAPPLEHSSVGSAAARERTAQERVAQRDIQQAINEWLEFSEARDMEAISRTMTPDFELHLLDGTVLNRGQALEGMRQEWSSVLRVSDQTAITVESLALSGPRATVYTLQRYVRYLPDRKDGSPHEVITNVRHRETWVFTARGWIMQRVEEIEQGATTLDGEPYQP